jgi:hypothetical protein
MGGPKMSKSSGMLVVLSAVAAGFLGGLVANGVLYDHAFATPYSGQSAVGRIEANEFCLSPPDGREYPRIEMGWQGTPGQPWITFWGENREERMSIALAGEAELRGLPYIVLYDKSKRRAAWVWLNDESEPELSVWDREKVRGALRLDTRRPEIFLKDPNGNDIFKAP